MAAAFVGRIHVECDGSTSVVSGATMRFSDAPSAPRPDRYPASASAKRGASSTRKTQARACPKVPNSVRIEDPRPREAHWNLQAEVELTATSGFRPKEVHMKDPQARLTNQEEKAMAQSDPRRSSKVFLA